MIDRRHDLELLVREPAFKKLAALPLRVLDVLLAHRNSQSGVAWPFQETIAELVGTDRTAVSRAVRTLKGWELVAVERRRYLDTSRLFYSFPFLDRGDTGATSADGGDVTPAPRRKAGSTWRQSQPQRDNGALMDVAPAPHRPKEEPGNDQQQQRAPPAAAPAAAGGARNEPAPEVLHELDLASIAEPVRSSLAAARGITPRMVRQAKVPGRGPGATVENIRASLRLLRARDEEQVCRRRRENKPAASTAERIRAEDAATERPDPSWIHDQARRHGLHVPLDGRSRA